MSLPWSGLICLSVVQLCMGEPPVEELIRAVETPLQGGWSDINPESPQVQVAAQFAVTTFNTITAREKLFKLIATPDVKTQTTCTVNYRIYAILAKTKCLKADNPDLDTCRLTKKRLLCLFVVTFNPRNNQHDLQRRRCNGYTEIS